uniref:Radical SAM protein n=1 Tax=candidate division WOR-3 bacterium TaxID=2052148 RepID=A0A7C4TIT5_UNCW3
MNYIGQKKFFGFQWHITNFCNLRCHHCYQEDFTKTADLDFKAIQKIINKITTALPETEILVNITGGEPFLHDAFYKILDHLEDKSNISAINLITNGLLLNQNITRIEEYKKIKELKISLEGNDCQTNDSIRGRGVFNRVVKNIMAIRNQTQKEIVLMFTLGSYNYKNLFLMLQFAKNIEADGIIVERFVPWGKGRMLKNQYLKKDEWEWVIRAIIQYMELDYSPLELLPYKAFHIELKKEIGLKGAPCNLGEESMALLPNGDVYPCRRFPTKIGNILVDEFYEIILRLKILKESLEKNLKGKCGNCQIKGCIGCRAIAYALTGDFYAEDPQCFR